VSCKYFKEPFIKIATIKGVIEAHDYMQLKLIRFELHISTT
jgi:hypothetical protein